MRTGFLAALTVLLAGQGLAFAQQALELVRLEPQCDVDTPARTCGFWGSGEYLLWWFKNGRVPPLVTAGDSGVLGAPGTQLLLDNLDFADDLRQGGRFALGYHFATMPCLGVEASYFFLPDRQTEASLSSNGDPLLAQPFFNIF